MDDRAIISFLQRGLEKTPNLIVFSASDSFSVFAVFNKVPLKLTFSNSNPFKPDIFAYSGFNLGSPADKNTTEEIWKHIEQHGKEYLLQVHNAGNSKYLPEPLKDALISII